MALEIWTLIQKNLLPRPQDAHIRVLKGLMQGL